jgi:hypothetical protein
VKEFFETLLLGQPRSSSKSSGETPDQIVTKMVERMAAELPDQVPLNIEENPTSLQIFRFQEISQINRLLRVMK